MKNGKFKKIRPSVSQSQHQKQNAKEAKVEFPLGTEPPEFIEFNIPGNSSFSKWWQRNQPKVELFVAGILGFVIHASKFIILASFIWILIELLQVIFGWRDFMWSSVVVCVLSFLVGFVSSIAQLILLVRDSERKNQHQDQDNQKSAFLNLVHEKLSKK